MGFIERKLETIAWDEARIGKPIEGRLLSMERVKFQDGGVNLRYKLDAGKGEFVVFQGSTQLNQMAQLDDVGCNVFIEYLGEDKSRQVQQGKNLPKRFKYMVDPTSKIRVTAPDGDPGINDSDIPF